MRTLILLLLSLSTFAQPAIYGDAQIITFETLPTSGVWNPMYSDQIVFSASYDWDGATNYTIEVLATAPQTSNMEPPDGAYSVITSASLFDGYDFGFDCNCTQQYQSVFGSLHNKQGQYIFVKFRFVGGPDHHASTQIQLNSNKLQVYENLVNGELFNTNQGYYKVLDVQPVNRSQTIVSPGGLVFVDINPAHTDTSFTNKFFRGELAFNLSKVQSAQAYIAAKRNLESFSWKFEDAYGCCTNVTSSNRWIVLLSTIKAWSSQPYTLTYTFAGVEITAELL